MRPDLRWVVVDPSATWAYPSCMDRRLVGLLAGVGAAASALMGLAHGDLVPMIAANAGLATGLAACLALPTPKKMSSFVQLHKILHERGGGSSLVRPSDRCQGLPWKISVKGLPRVRGRARGRALDGDLSRQQDARRESDGPLSLRVRGHHGGVPAGSARLRARGCGPAAVPRPVGFRP